MSFGFQLSIMPQATKSKIANALKALLDDMPILNYVAFDRVRLYTSDFKEDEIPAAQFIDVAEQITHERNRTLRTWSISLEVIHKSTPDGYVDQQFMWNLEYQIGRKIWAQPNLGIPGVIHCRYISNATDLHMMEPFYLLRMDFDVLYYEHLVSDC